MPTVNRLTIHILAAAAEEEAHATLMRTKAALAVAKAQITKLGKPAAAARRQRHGCPQGLEIPIAYFIGTGQRPSAVRS